MPPHPVDSPEPGTLTPIARACRRGLRGVLLLGLLLCPPAQGWAQTDTPAAVRIDGGDLADVLNRYAREAGVSLSYDASLLRGLTWLAGRPAPGRRQRPLQCPAHRTGTAPGPGRGAVAGTPLERHRHAFAAMAG